MLFILKHIIVSILILVAMLVEYIPSSNVNNSLHLSSLSVALKLSIKFILFSTQHTALAVELALSIASIAFLNLYFEKALVALQNSNCLTSAYNNVKIWVVEAFPSMILYNHSPNP